MYGVRDHHEELGDNVHDDRDLIGHHVVYRPNKSYQPVYAPG